MGQYYEINFSFTHIVTKMYLMSQQTIEAQIYSDENNLDYDPKILLEVEEYTPVSSNTKHG